MNYLQPSVLGLNGIIQSGLDRGCKLVLIVAADKTSYLKLEEPK